MGFKCVVQDMMVYQEDVGSFAEVIMDSLFALTLNAPLSSLSPRSPASRAGVF